MSELIGSMTDSASRNVQVTVNDGAVFIQATPHSGKHGRITLTTREKQDEFSQLIIPAIHAAERQQAEVHDNEPVIPATPDGCDSLQFGGGPPSMLDGQCRCTVCGRCGHHTGNSHQGHYWAWCKVTKSVREFHFCCPAEAGGCELEAKATQPYRRPCCDHCNNLAGDPAGHDYGDETAHDGPCEQCDVERAREEAIRDAE